MVANLRKLRLSRGISQQQLADMIVTSQQSINKYENHNVEPDIYTLAKIADLFGTTIDYLVGHTAPDLVPDLVKEPILSKAERAFIQDYRKLSKAEKESIRAVIRNYLSNRPAPLDKSFSDAIL